ncbi:hypothetical protein PCANC_01168 [Puccinia coronata f. sp. avenae]|uniref:Uncharacterized protein n=1 Tax=Puccinia coronata f. sp. avenae TaxID=200324 RepID=A0A2N5W5Y0_9BASI|nr:hypothetical protein PCANC_01168 [Puccinia coronata f. sp. avenae]
MDEGSHRHSTLDDSMMMSLSEDLPDRKESQNSGPGRVHLGGDPNNPSETVTNKNLHH